MTTTTLTFLRCYVATKACNQKDQYPESCNPVFFYTIEIIHSPPLNQSRKAIFYYLFTIYQFYKGESKSIVKNCAVLRHYFDGILEKLFNMLPIDNIPPGADVIGTFIAIF